MQVRNSFVGAIEIRSWIHHLHVLFTSRSLRSLHVRYVNRGPLPSGRRTVSVVALRGGFYTNEEWLDSDGEPENLTNSIG